jgi:hypothetical protein
MAGKIKKSNGSRAKKKNKRGSSTKRRKTSSSKVPRVKGSSVKTGPRKRATGRKSAAKARKKKPVSSRAARNIKKASRVSSRKIAKIRVPRKVKATAGGKKRMSKVKTRLAKPGRAPVKAHGIRRPLRNRVVKSHVPPVKPPFEAYRGIRPFLFVSYSHRNMEEVFKILKRIHENRYRVWYDEGIEPGNEWPEVVGKAIVKCSQYLVFMTPSAALSRNVRNEVNLAFTENKEIIVVNLEETRLTSGMKLQIGTVQHINRYEMGEKEFYEKLFKVLRSDLKS